MNTNWKQYKRKGLSEMRPYEIGEDVSKVSISEPDKLNGSPKEGDMIARNPQNHDDQWLVAKKYFEDNLELALQIPMEIPSDWNSTKLNSLLRFARKNSGPWDDIVGNLPEEGDADLIIRAVKAFAAKG